MLQSFAKLNAKFEVVICINMIKIYDLGTDSVSKVRYLLMLFRKHPGVEWGGRQLFVTSRISHFNNKLLAIIQ